MTKDEEQLIANIMYRMHANEQARLDAALSSARAESVARSEADRKRIEALTADLSKEREAHAETADLLNKASEKVRGLCVQAQDQREEIIRLNEAHGKTMVERDALRDQLDNAKRSALDAVLVLDVEEGESPNAAVRRIVKERDGMRAEVAEMRKHCDALRAEVAQLKSQTPKQHPVKAGEWLRKTTDGLMYKAGERFRLTSYKIINGEIWCNLENGASWLMSVCTPCDPPTEATHDTPEGRIVVESVIRDDRKIEPDEIKVGDVVEVFQATDANWTRADEIGIKGTVQRINMSGVVYLSNDGAYALQDVRKVTT